MTRGPKNVDHLWTVGGGLFVDRMPSTDSGPWSVDRGPYAVDRGLSTVDQFSIPTYTLQ
jgi:hypothetical protein